MSTEREFLHSLSTPLTVLQLHLDRLCRQVEMPEPIDPAVLAKALTTCRNQVVKSVELVESRRAELKKNPT